MIAFVLCSGQSLTQVDVDMCRGKGYVVAVSDAIRMAPWADALVSHDRAWWKENKDLEFSGPRFHAHGEEIEGMERLTPTSNSGCLGVQVAARQNPDKIILLGADLHGTHFFGRHKRLRNTQPHQFETMKRQYAKFAHLPVVNCSPISTLKCFRKSDLRTELADLP